jgi:hypothetical protein
MKKEIEVKIPAQSFRIEVEIPDYVTPPDTNPPTDAPGPVDPPPTVPTGFKMGSNGFPWSPMSLYTGAGLEWIRCYFATGWGSRPNGLHIQPLWQAGTPEAWGMDDYLQKAKDAGLNVIWCNHQTPEWFRNTGRSDGNNDFAPIPAGAKRDDPVSYKYYASYLFQIAARYGSVKHPDSVLQVDPEARWAGDGNVKKSGLNLLRFLEPWNEEKWWLKGTEGYVEPETMAALMSACYDGHEGKLGAGHGIRTADPQMIVVMPGLTDFDMPYIEAMGDWFQKNRADQEWPCHVLNLHHYSNIGNKPKQHPAQWKNDGGCPPSEDKNFDTVKDMISLADSLGLPTWITEFGYDTKAPSNMRIAGKNGKSDEQAQSDALVETFKKYREYGVDACFLFNIHDDIGAADGGQFETSGIYSSKATGFIPKPAVTALKAYAQSLKPTEMATAKNFEISAASFKRPKKK